MTTLNRANRELGRRSPDEWFDSLEDGIAFVEDRASKSVDHRFLVKQAEVTVESDGSLTLNTPTFKSPFNHTSFVQFARQVEAPVDWLFKTDPELAATNINYAIQKKGASNPYLELKALDYDSGSYLRAVNSDSYGRLFDYFPLKLAAEVQARSGGEFFFPKTWDKQIRGLAIGERDMFVFMINGGSMVEGPKNEINLGFFLGNSEIGYRSLLGQFFMHNGVCGNLFVWGAKMLSEIKFRHSKHMMQRFNEEAIPQIMAIEAPNVEPIQVAFRNMAQKSLPEPKKTLELLVKFGYTKKQSDNILEYAEREEGTCSNAYDLYQGATAMARDASYLDSTIELSRQAYSIVEWANA